jgi:serine/threonine-protein kinase
LSANGPGPDLTISPDGSRVIYVGNNGTQLFVRPLDVLEPVAIFTGTPRGPFVSPDGQWVGFIDVNTLVKKVAMTGGPAITLATLGSIFRGATWITDDTIIAATISGDTGLLRVDATGGGITVLTRPDRALGELDHFWPEMLPGGRAVLFTIMPAVGGLDAAQVAVLDLQTGTRKILVRGGSHAHYAPGGHLVYAAAGTLRAVRFDFARLEVEGKPVPAIPEVATTAQGAANAVVARDGTLAYLSGMPIGNEQQTLVWVDRQGHETALPAPPRAYRFPRLSPDGARVAVFTPEQAYDIWLLDVGRTALTRLTSDPAVDTYPVWTGDGGVIFTSERTGGRNLFLQAANGTGPVERLTDSPNVQVATAVSPDGAHLIFTETAQNTGQDVMQLELGATRRLADREPLGPSASGRGPTGSATGERVEPRAVTPLVQTPFTERNGVVSPDGHWLAYEANDSGRFEIFVRPFPDVNSGRWVVSGEGGTQPLWTRRGQELVYASPTGALMRVSVERGASWIASAPTQVVKAGYRTVSADIGRSYDIAPDGQRFLMIKEGSRTDRTAAARSLIVVQHWDEELTRLLPSR